MSDGWVWYDKNATDDRVWCVKSGDVTVRCKSVSFFEGDTHFKPQGHAELQPGGPRGAILASGIRTLDEIQILPVLDPLSDEVLNDG